MWMALGGFVDAVNGFATLELTPMVAVQLEVVPFIG